MQLFETYGFSLEMIMKGLANMKELRFLQLGGPNAMQFLYREVSNCNWNLPNGLRFLRWEAYPFSSLPKTFQPINLVGLQMDCGKMVQLWKDGEEKDFPNLRFLKLYRSEYLRTLDLSVAPNLETLDLQGCYDLERLHTPAESPKLTSLGLYYSKKLRSLHLGITPNLKTLSLTDCQNMVELQIPGECPKLVNLDLNGNGNLRTLDLMVMPNLVSLNLKDCYGLKEINAPAEYLKKLLHLNLSYCGRFRSFKFDKVLDSTEVVSLSELRLIAYDANDPGNTWQKVKFSCYYKEDPASSIGNIERLISLGFGAPINADSFSDIICGLQCLRKLTIEGGIPEAPKNLDRLDCLEELNLWWTDVKTLPDSICMLQHLKSLSLVSCWLLEKLPVDIGRLECLESLILFMCTLLQDLPNSICEMKSLKCLDLTKCFLVVKLPEEIGRLKCLKELNVLASGINHLPDSVHSLRGTRIIGHRWLLESCGLTPNRRRISDDEWSATLSH